MKLGKKILTLCAAVLMVFALCTTAMAAEEVTVPDEGELTVSTSEDCPWLPCGGCGLPDCTYCCPVVCEPTECPTPTPCPTPTCDPCDPCTWPCGGCGLPTCTYCYPDPCNPCETVCVTPTCDPCNPCGQPDCVICFPDPCNPCATVCVPVKPAPPKPAPATNSRIDNVPKTADSSMNLWVLTVVAGAALTVAVVAGKKAFSR